MVLLDSETLINMKRVLQQFAKDLRRAVSHIGLRMKVCVNTDNRIYAGHCIIQLLPEGWVVSDRSRDMILDRYVTPKPDEAVLRVLNREFMHRYDEFRRPLTVSASLGR